MHEADSFDRTEITPDGGQPDGAPDQPEAASGKSRVHYTSDDAGDTGAIAVRQSNSQTVIDAIFDAATRKLRAASGTSFETLKAHAEIGNDLHELKQHLVHGNFEREVTARLGIKKAWRCRLMDVGENWLQILMAIDDAKANNQLTSTEYSVDGALALLKRWQHKVNGVDTDKSKTAKQKSYTDDFVPNKTFGNKADFIEFLKQVIYCLRSDNEVLRREIAALQAELSRYDVTIYPDAPCPDQLVPALPAGEVAEQ